MQAINPLQRVRLIGLLLLCFSLFLLLYNVSNAQSRSEITQKIINKDNVQTKGDSRLADFINKVDPATVFPGATRFGKPTGKPAVAIAYTQDKPVGYVYITSDIVNTRGYSSYPIDIMVGLDNQGSIVGAKLLEHHEPIVLIGIKESKIENFINGYIGKSYIKNPPKPGAAPPVDIVSGATVTLMVVGDSITRSVIAVGRHYLSSDNKILEKAKEQRVINPDINENLNWQELLSTKAVTRLNVTIADVNQAFEQTGKKSAIAKPETGDPDDTFIDIYTAQVSVPSIGKNLLGEAEWHYLKDRLKPGQQAILVFANGTYSFKGSGYVRGGIFDRIEVIQEEQSFHFTDLQHQRLADLMAQGAPDFKEIALFVVAEDAVFDPVQPWRLQLLIQRVINVKEKVFTTFSLNYQLPEQFTELVPNSDIDAEPTQLDQGQISVQQQQADIENAPPLWQQIWSAKTGQIITLVIALIILIAVFFFQDTLSANEVFYQRFRIIYLIFTLFWIGWYASAQLSVVNVLTFTASFRSDFSWGYFLMDPMVFILWVATATSILFWNRGAFCGWLCPFGALQELTNKLARFFHVPQIKVSYGVNTRLVALKYVIFLVLFGVSFYEIGLAEKLAEVEPFKTAIILKFIRDWPFVVFAVLLLVAGLFIERFYCRYLCPLGAALAIPARLRIFNWLKRYKMCGNPCQLCAVECPVQVIAPDGDINPNECIQCLNCQMLYHNDKRCPHLLQKKAKLKRTKLPPPDIGISGEVIASRKPTVKPRSIS